MYHLCLAGHVLSQTSTLEDKLNSVEINENQPNKKRKAVSSGLPTARESPLSGMFRQRSRQAGLGRLCRGKGKASACPGHRRSEEGRSLGAGTSCDWPERHLWFLWLGLRWKQGHVGKALAAERWLGQEFLLSFPLSLEGHRASFRSDAGWLPGLSAEAGGGLSGQVAEVVVPTRGLATGPEHEEAGCRKQYWGPQTVALARCTGLSEVNATPAEGSVVTCD